MRDFVPPSTVARSDFNSVQSNALRHATPHSRSARIEEIAFLLDIFPLVLCELIAAERLGKAAEKKGIRSEKSCRARRRESARCLSCVTIHPSRANTIPVAHSHRYASTFPHSEFPWQTNWKRFGGKPIVCAVGVSSSARPSPSAAALQSSWESFKRRIM